VACSALKPAASKPPRDAGRCTIRTATTKSCCRGSGRTSNHAARLCVCRTSWRIFAARGVTASIARQGSAFSYYLMPKVPADFHDILEHHDFERDAALRRTLIELGVFFVPIATKQCSISAAHTVEDIDLTLEQFERAVSTVWAGRNA